MADRLPAEVDVGDGQWWPAKAKHLEKNAYAVELRMDEEVVRSHREAGYPEPRIRIQGRPATFVPSKTLRMRPTGEWVILALADLE
jgi:hypothetical protein